MGVQCWKCARSQGLDKGVLLVYGGSWVALLQSGQQLSDSRLVGHETTSLPVFVVMSRLCFYPSGYSATLRCLGTSPSQPATAEILLPKRSVLISLLAQIFGHKVSQNRTAETRAVPSLGQMVM